MLKHIFYIPRLAWFQIFYIFRGVLGSKYSIYSAVCLVPNILYNPRRAWSQKFYIFHGVLDSKYFIYSAACLAPIIFYIFCGVLGSKYSIYSAACLVPNKDLLCGLEILDVESLNWHENINRLWAFIDKVQTKGWAMSFLNCGLTSYIVTLKEISPKNNKCPTNTK